MKRYVIKIGSSSLTTDGGGLDRERVEFYSSELARMRQAGHEVLLVTSGAVAAGFRQLGYPARPKALHEKQASASVGQALLMQAYHESFKSFGIGVAQILLTRSDFSDRKRVSNALMTIEELLRRGTVPIINENDTVSVDELKFGDNDKLSALVANLAKAHRLLIFTDMDGLYTDNPRTNPQAERIERVYHIDENLYRAAGGAGSAVGTGGMRSKVEAARIAMRGGVPVFVGRASEPGDALEAAEHRGKGTYFETSGNGLSMKKQWVGFHSPTLGTIRVDDGAANALLEQGRSLLPAGVILVDGDFHPGDVVEVHDARDVLIGRGVVNYTAAQLQAAAGLSTAEVGKRFELQRIEVIHRDEWLSLT